MPPPPSGTDAEAGVRHYTHYIALGPNRQDAANLLKNWLTEQICADADPGDYGALYCLWADLEDVADAYEDEQAFDEAARLAAEEWLAGAAKPSSGRHGWPGGTSGCERMTSRTPSSGCVRASSRRATSKCR